MGPKLLNSGLLYTIPNGILVITPFFKLLSLLNIDSSILNKSKLPVCKAFKLFQILLFTFFKILFVVNVLKSIELIVSLFLLIEYKFSIWISLIISSLIESLIIYKEIRFNSLEACSNKIGVKRLLIYFKIILI